MGKYRRTAKQLALLTFCLCWVVIRAAWAENRGSIKIGMLLPMSGNYAVIGSDSSQGFELAMDELGGRGLVELRYADSKADGNAAITEFRKLVEQDGVAAIFTFRSPVGKAVNPISLQEKIPLLGGVGYKEFPEVNAYAFQLWPASDFEGGFIAEQILKDNLRRVALFTAQDEWTQSVSDGFRKGFSAAGGSLVADLEMVPSDTDFRTLLASLRDKNLEAIFLNVSLPQIAPFVRQVREQGYKVPLFSNFWAAKKEVLQALGQAGSEGLMFMEVSTDLPELNVNIQRRYGASTSGATLSGYIGGALLLQAVKSLQAEGDHSAENLQRRLTEQSEVRTKYGTFAVNQRRVIFPMALKVIKEGGVVEKRRS